MAVTVSLPDDVHTQSNRPRDPLLIPTTLTVDAPPGFTVDSIVWPPASDFAQSAQDEPLSVFEHKFSIGVMITLAADAAAGVVKVP
jgi:hypothetical protein